MNHHESKISYFELINMYRSASLGSKLVLTLTAIVALVAIATAGLLYRNRNISISPSNPGSEPNAQVATTGISLSLQPASSAHPSNTTGRTLNVMPNTNGRSMSGAELVITFNPGIIRVTNVQPGPFFTDPGIGNPVEVRKTIDNAAGKIHYALGFPLGSGYSSSANKSLAIITFSTLGAGTTAVNFVTSGLPRTFLTNTTGENILGMTTGATVTSGMTSPCVSSRGDANADGVINLLDLAIIQTHFGQTTQNGSRDGDFNCDGRVDIVDLQIWSANTTQTPTPTPVLSTATQLRPSADSHVRAGSPNTNYGSLGTLHATSTNRITYMKFDLTSLGGRTINKAELKLYVTNPTGGTLNVKRLTSSWFENTVTFKTKPNLGTLIKTFSSPGSGGAWASVDLTTFVNNNKGTPVSFAIETSSGDEFVFNSREASSNKPYLLIQ